MCKGPSAQTVDTLDEIIVPHVYGTTQEDQTVQNSSPPLPTLQPIRTTLQKRPSDHSNINSADLGAAFPTVVGQVLEEWENKTSALRRFASLDGAFSPTCAAPAVCAPESPDIIIPQHTEIQLDEIDLLDNVGRGANGSVYRAVWHGASVAVKYIPCSTEDPDSLGRAVREVVLAKRCQHPNVVQTFVWTVLTDEDCKHHHSAKPHSSSAKKRLDIQFGDTGDSLLLGDNGEIPAAWPKEIDEAIGACSGPDKGQDESRADSFNSEEGFGSPVKHRRGGVRSIFALEGLLLNPAQALVVVVMEYCDLGSLSRAIKRKTFKGSTKWSWQTSYRALLRTAQEITQGMIHIHQHGLVHLDLKPANILLRTHRADRRGFVAKVADFGLARAAVGGSIGDTIGTTIYAAPEVLAGENAGPAADVYSFGILLHEMFHSTHAYDGLLEGQIMAGVMNGTLRPSWDGDCPTALMNLAESCWAQEPLARPTFKAVAAELVSIEMDFRTQQHRGSMAARNSFAIK